MVYLIFLQFFLSHISFNDWRVYESSWVYFTIELLHTILDIVILCLMVLISNLKSESWLRLTLVFIGVTKIYFVIRGNKLTSFWFTMLTNFLPVLVLLQCFVWYFCVWVMIASVCTWNHSEHFFSSIDLVLFYK